MFKFYLKLRQLNFVLKSLKRKSLVAGIVLFQKNPMFPQQKGLEIPGVGRGVKDQKHQHESV